MKKFVNYLGNLITIVSLLYIAVSISKMNMQLNAIENKQCLALVCLGGILITLTGLFLLSFAWKIPLDYFGERRVNYYSAWPVYLKANIGKYLPGNIMHYVERNIFASELGLSQFFIVFSSALELGIIIITAFILSLLFSYKNIVLIIKEMSVKYYFIFIAVGGLILILAAAVFFARTSVKFRAIMLKIKQKNLSVKDWFVIFVKMFLIYSVALALGGICFTFICKYALNVSLDIKHFLFLIACYILAWLVGYCMPGAPGGMGIREFVLILLTKSMLEGEQIYLAILLQRVISILGDLLGFFLAILRLSYDRKRTK